MLKHAKQGLREELVEHEDVCISLHRSGGSFRSEGRLTYPVINVPAADGHVGGIATGLTTSTGFHFVGSSRTLTLD